MKEYIFIAKELLKGRSLLRAYLNLRLTEETLRGDTINVGGGSGHEYYELPIPRADDVTFKNLDVKTGETIDFERDHLPAATGQYDTVLFLNVMEHIFNHQHIANEVVRITKPGGQMIGYVPFLMWFHPDHKDFFRYTHEALEIIMERTGATDVKIEAIARGPFVAAQHMIYHLMPKVLRPVLFLPVYVLDQLFLKFQNKPDDRYALGYMFIVRK